MKEAIGGYSNTSAYCLIYLSDNVIQEERSSKKERGMEVQDSKIIEIEKQHYLDLLPASISDEIDADNVVFHNEIEEYKFNSYLKTITDSYKARYDAVVKALDVKDQKAVPTSLNTFACHLKNLKPAEDDLFKWYLLDATLQDSEKKTRLTELIHDSPNLTKLLEDRFSSLPKPYTFKHIVLSPQEHEKLGTNLSEYDRSYQIIIFAKFCLASFLEERWMDAMYAARHVREVMVYLSVQA